MTTPTHNQDECREALKWLVALKAHKDEHGKTDHYNEMQPKAWQKAKEALNHRPKPPADNEMVELVAIAISPWFNGLKHKGDPQKHWDNLHETFKGAYRIQAKAAIAALSNGSAPVGEPGELEYLQAFHEVAQALIGTVHLAIKDGDLGRALARMEVYKAKLPKFKTDINPQQPQPNGSATDEGVKK